MREHGTHAKYVVDRCRCDPCKQANRDYERQRASRVEPPYINAQPAREWVQHLMACGLGPKRIAEVAGISHGGVSKLLYGDYKKRGPSKRIRRETAERLLAVKPGDAADGAKVDAGPSWRLIDEMVAAGVSKVAIARQLGQTGPGLQLGRRLISARNARAVQRVYDDWKAGRVELRTRGHRHAESVPVAAPTRRESLVERRARWAEYEQLVGELVDVLEVRNARTWAGEAACRGRDVNMWFPARGDRRTRDAALRICRSCLVRAQCAAEADGTNTRLDGIYAAQSAKHRRTAA